MSMLAGATAGWQREEVRAAGASIRVAVLRDRDPRTPVLPIAAALLHLGGERSVALPDTRIYGRWIKLIEAGTVEPAPPATADVQFVAHDALLHRAASERAQRSGDPRLPTVLHSESDDVATTRPAGATLLRSSAFASRMGRHESIATGCVPDLMLERADEWPELAPWSDRPSIGFMGHVTAGLRSIPYLRQGWQHFHGFRFRDRVLRVLEESDALATEFVRRGRNLGPPMAGVDQDEARRRMRREYVGSVFRNPYALCVRGAGNWSYRLFETLAAGRIPLLVDTDCALPLEDVIPWDDHLCRIPARRLAEAPRMLVDFHRRLGPDGLEALQRRNRDMWQQLLEPSAFFARALRNAAAAKVSRTTGDAVEPDAPAAGAWPLHG